MMPTAPTGQDGGLSVASSTEQRRLVNRRSRRRNPFAFAITKIKRLQSGPVLLIAPQWMRPGFCRVGHQQIAMGILHGDHPALVENWFMQAGVMPPKGNPVVGPRLVAGVVKHLDPAAHVHEADAFAIRDRRGGGVVTKQTGQVRIPRARYQTPPKFLPVPGVKANPNDVRSVLGIPVDRLMAGHEDPALGNDRRALPRARKLRPPYYIAPQSDAELRGGLTLDTEIAIGTCGLGQMKRRAGRGRERFPRPAI